MRPEMIAMSESGLYITLFHDTDIGPLSKGVNVATIESFIEGMNGLVNDHYLPLRISARGPIDAPHFSGIYAPGDQILPRLWTVTELPFAPKLIL
jgi:hypothetical protein